jgi:hypothetical protein
VAGGGGITFEDAVRECLGNASFMREYRRLAKTDFGTSRGINLSVDLATGHFDAQARAFFDFVMEFVWLPLVARPA